VSCACQAASFVLRMVSMVVLARLLVPEDFGLVGMVTAITGFLALFKEAGLSNASVQSATITHDQLSVLFWINVAVGCGLALLCAASAPALAAFYGEPRLFWITLAAGTSFVFTGLATQHRSIMLRNMQFPMLGLIEILSLAVSIAASIGMAAAGCGYWALIPGVVLLPACNAAGVWLAAAWIPGRPRRRSGVRHLILYGGTVTVNSVVVYLAYNAEKVLLGRFWGAEVLGIYGRAYGLINLPTDSLQSTLGWVAFPALSRVQEDPARLKRYFLRGYSLFLSAAFPLTMGCALFADDIIRVFLGPKWHEAAGVFRLLAPTILVFAVINPFGLLLFATGRVVRSLKIALVIAPVVILAYVLGLGRGPTGVALGFSSAMVLLMIPVVLWAKRGTLISARDVFKILVQPGGSILVATGASLGLSPWVSTVSSPLGRLTVESSLLFGVYLVLLLFVFGQKAAYVELLQHTRLWPPGRKGTASVED
jgi:O-antigen/teichoic acid export membrane protein